jgi:hypothetical protein
LHHIVLEPLSYERPASCLGDPRSDVRRERVPIRAAVEPEKMWVQINCKFSNCNARGLENFRHDHEIACFCEMIGDVTNATTVPAPNIWANENCTTRRPEISSQINFNAIRNYDLCALVIIGGSQIAVGIRGATRHLCGAFDRFVKSRRLRKPFEAK